MSNIKVQNLNFLSNTFVKQLVGILVPKKWVYWCQKSGHIGAKIGGYIGARPNVIRVGILVPDSLGKDGAHPGSAELVYALLLASVDALLSSLL